MLDLKCVVILICINCMIINLNMAMNSHLRPPFFEGRNEDAERWIDAFERYSDFADWPSKKKYNALRTMLQGEAAEWLLETKEIVEETAEDERYEHLKELFLLKFKTSDTEKFQRRMELGRLRQGRQESVEEYRRRFESLCRKSSVVEDGPKLQYFIQGLLPLLQAHVIRNMPKLYNEAVNLASAEEGARGVSGLDRDSKNNELEDMMEKVFKKVLALNRLEEEQPAGLCSIRAGNRSVNPAPGPEMTSFAAASTCPPSGPACEPPSVLPFQQMATGGGNYYRPAPPPVHGAPMNQPYIGGQPSGQPYIGGQPSGQPYVGGTRSVWVYPV